MKCTIDFETRSDIDLKEQGLDVYAKSKHTDILCMAYKFGDDTTQLWKMGEVFPIDLAIHLSEGGSIYAHNASFEWSIWNLVGVKKYGWPTLPIEQTFCNMAQALAMGLPGALEKLALALIIEQQKDMTGNRVMLQLSKPRKVQDDGTIIWWEDADKFETLYKYCIQDVEVEHATSKYLKELSPLERRVWLLDHKINQRGILVDLESIAIAENIIEGEKERLDAEMRSVSNLGVASCSAAAQITNYLRSRGIELNGVTKSEVTSLLSSDLPDDCRRVLELRQEGSKSSTAKLKAMRLRASEDGRIRNTKQYCGAQATGRWAGRGAQFDNLPRPANNYPTIEKILNQELVKGAEYLDTFYGQPTSLISDCLRSVVFAPEGSTLAAQDWSNIEGRALAWLADEQWKIKAFADFDAGIGHDIYKLSYSAAFHISVERCTTDERQIGKVLELSMGFQGGVKAFHSMAKNYGVTVTDERADELKNAWRLAHPRIKAYWYAQENAAVNAVLNPGKIFTAGPSDHRQIKYRVNGKFLECRLPSGRCLHYFSPEIKRMATPWDEMKNTVSYISEDSVTRKLTRSHLYGGLLTENITQAVARDILAEALLRLDDSGYPITMHVHDEIVAEILKKELNVKNEKTMAELMCVLPTWAMGLPIKASGWTGKRYRKD